MTYLSVIKTITASLAFAMLVISCGGNAASITGAVEKGGDPVGEAAVCHSGVPARYTGQKGEESATPK